MTNDVIIKIQGLQEVEENDGTEVIQTISPGTYYFKNGKHYVLYEEMGEDLNEVIKARIKMEPDRMEIQKKGGASFHLILEKDKKNLTNYTTPFGEIVLGICATKIEFQNEEDRILATADYELEMNYQYVSTNHISIEILSSGTKVRLG